ncbi:MAG: hypothetical protein IPM25_16140 [Chloracidobacterium sp.]|nr:hypothetical protein [Chloracidobacterium sp.]
MGLFVVLTFTAVLFIGCSRVFDNSRTELAERAIRENPDLKRIDDICRSIPVPAGSKFVGKAWLQNLGGLLYNYAYDQELSEIPEHFERYFANNDWKKTDNDPTRSWLRYTKGDIKSEVYVGAIGTGISFSLYCGPISQGDESKN